MEAIRTVQEKTHPTQRKKKVFFLPTLLLKRVFNIVTTDILFNSLWAYCVFEDYVQ